MCAQQFHLLCAIKMANQLVIMQKAQALSLALEFWPDSPGKKSKLKLIGIFLLNCVMLYGLIGGFYLYIYVKNTQYSYAIVLRNFLYCILLTLTFVKHFTIYFNQKGFARVLRKIQNLWTEHFTETAETSGIFRQAEQNCNKLFWFFTFLHGSAVITHGAMTFYKAFNTSGDPFETINQSSDYDVIFPIQFIFICNTQTCIDYYIPCILTLSYGFIAGALMTFHDSFYFGMFIQAHGQLKMIKRQLEIYSEKYDNGFRMSTKKMELQEFKHLCKIVKLHCETVDVLNSIDDVTQIENIVHFICFTALLCLETIQLTGDLKDPHILFLAATTVLQVYLVSYYGQNIIDELDNFGNSLYFDTKWYMKSLSMQKLILIMMLRSSNVGGMTIGRTKIISFTYFTNMGQMAYCLFTLLKSPAVDLSL